MGEADSGYDFFLAHACMSLPHSVPLTRSRGPIKPADSSSAGLIGPLLFGG
jgi:hypothetical protein